MAEAMSTKFSHIMQQPLTFKNHPLLVHVWPDLQFKTVY